MKTTALSTFLLICLSSVCLADVVIYNTSKEALQYSSVSANGQTKQGKVKACRGSYPAQTRIKNKKTDKTKFTITRADGTVLHEGTGAYSRAFVVSPTGKGLSCSKVGWMLNNGQAAPQTFRLHNATGKDLTFDIVDEAQVRSSQTLAAGESKDFDGSNPQRNDRHTLKLSNGQTISATGRVGTATILHLKSNGVKIEGFQLGSINAPKGISD